MSLSHDQHGFKQAQSFSARASPHSHGDIHSQEDHFHKEPSQLAETQIPGQIPVWWSEKTRFSLWGAGTSSNYFPIISLIAAMLGATAAAAAEQALLERL